MPSSLHVSLPDEMRAFVDLKTNGGGVHATPSEYVRALIREDMENDAERRYVFETLLKSMDDIREGRTCPAEEVEKHMDALLDELDKEEKRGKGRLMSGAKITRKTK